MNYQTEKLESMIRKNKVLGIAVIIGFIFVFLGMIFCALTQNMELIPIVIVCFFLLFILAIALGILQTRIRRLFKQTIVNEALQRKFHNYQYLPNAELLRKEITSTNMIRMGNDYHAEDYIRGIYEGHSFQYSDVKISTATTEYRGTGDNRTSYTSYEYHFSGCWIMVKHDWKVYTRIEIVRKGYKYAMIPMEMMQISSNNYDIDRLFDVYIGRENSPYEILSDIFFECLEQLNHKIENIDFIAVTGNVLHIGINNKKDNFEPNFFKSMDLNSFRMIVDSEVNQIINSIDSLIEHKDLFSSIQY